jgi:2-phospho-L-lactate guanylyltransferase (CobY/MobA/RfbA family)
MTTVAVLADPPREGTVLPALGESPLLSDSDRVGLYTAMLRDVCRAVEDSGGELLVNYRPDDALPDAAQGTESAEAAVRAAVRPALSDPDEARFEVQVGETFSGRVGNTVTHLLDREGVRTAAAVEPTAPFLSRQLVDNAAMKLRRHDVVVGPAADGRVYYAGFGQPIDFADAYAPPAIRTLVERTVDADRSADFLPMQPVVETPADLAALVSQVQARELAGRRRRTHTAQWVADVGLDVREGADGIELTRD